MAFHRIEPDRRTLHGQFSRDLPPALTIDSGDTVQFRTLDAGWGLEPPHTDGTPRRKFEPRDPERDRGHALGCSVGLHNTATQLQHSDLLEELQRALQVVYVGEVEVGCLNVGQGLETGVRLHTGAQWVLLHLVGEVGLSLLGEHE